MATILEELRDRCVAAGLRAEVSQATTEPPSPQRLYVWYGDESEAERMIVRQAVAEFVAATQFDAFRPLQDYEAIWSPTLGVIECALEQGAWGMPVRYRLEAIARSLGISDANSGQADLTIPIPVNHDTMRATIGVNSNEFAVLRGGLFRPHMMMSDLERRPRRPVFRIEGAVASSAEDAARLLEKLGNAVLFQMDLITEVPLFLARRQDLGIGRPAPSASDQQFAAPAFQYDTEPMALYWYARTAFQTPLLAYLAFYQVLEFYFPAFSTEKAHAIIRNLLKDPRFDVSNDLHIARIAQSVKPNSSGRGFGDERAQLQATVQGCVTPQQMREFFAGDERLQKFYHRPSKQRMPIVDIRIPVDSDADLRPQVAQRIYEIRNRIVHTKSGEEGSEVLLPYSRESRLLRFDIQLIEYVARQALITTSQPLRL